MKLVVFTSKDKFHSEIPVVLKMFEDGLQTLHVRKPRFSTKELEEYILAIPEEYRNRLIIHSHHELQSVYKLKGIHFGRSHRKKGAAGGFQKLSKFTTKGKKIFTKSAHSLSSIDKDVRFYDYIFLSPIFDSISKDNHKSKFGSKALRNTLSKTKQTVYALGGVEAENLHKVVEYGFDGAALLGSIWESEKPPFEAYKEIKDLAKKL